MLFRACASENIDLVELRPKKTTLEDVFLELASEPAWDVEKKTDTISEEKFTESEEQKDDCSDEE